jgi:hypothetical protein
VVELSLEPLALLLGLLPYRKVAEDAQEGRSPTLKNRMRVGFYRNHASVLPSQAVLRRHGIRSAEDCGDTSLGAFSIFRCEKDEGWAPGRVFPRPSDHPAESRVHIDAASVRDDDNPIRKAFEERRGPGLALRQGVTGREALGDVANGADDDSSLLGFHVAQAHLHGNLRPVPMAREEFEAGSHEPRVRPLHIARAVREVALTMAFRHEHLHLPPE